MMIESEALRSVVLSAAVLFAVTLSPTFAQDSARTTAPQSTDTPSDDPAVSLFDGRTLDGWSKTEFGGQREVAVVDGVIQLNAGDPLTGITFHGDPPKQNYELTLQARKLKGHDFFCAATFPVEDSHCTLVLGGWGGTVVGLSCIDGRDASENETTQYKKFEPDRWYSVRIRVTPERIECWLDDEPIVNASISGRKISLRTEVVRCKPLGFCSYLTQAQLRGIEIRKWDAEKSTTEEAKSESDK